MACMMCIVAGLMVSLFVPNGSINKLYSFLRRILKGQGCPEDSEKDERLAEKGRFFGNFEVTWGM